VHPSECELVSVCVGGGVRVTLFVGEDVFVGVGGGVIVRLTVAVGGSSTLDVAVRLRVELGVL
jgi:hypothetical protein